MDNEHNLEGKDILNQKVEKPIGQGKFAVVQRAKHLETQKPIALKVIKVFDQMDQVQREKCFKEIKLLKSVEHPNIVKYLDSSIQEGELIIAVEWCEQGDLKKVLKQAKDEVKRLDENRIWNQVQQLAGALKQMHALNILHRDIKPANILIGADGTLKLGDLGLGRFLTSQTMEARTKVGTPLYMSPEVLSDSGYDQKADVWSLGCLAYELCQLQSPFKTPEDSKMSLQDLFHKIQKGQYKRIDDEYSDELRNFVDAMLILDTSKRLSSKDCYELCEKRLRSRPRVDPALIMEDIHDKLQLLNQEHLFCAKGFKIIPKQYFCADFSKETLFISKQFHADNTNIQFVYFIELVQWLLSFDLSNFKRVAGKLSDFSTAVHQFQASVGVIEMLKAFNISIPDQINANLLKDGRGEGVIYVINETINYELMRRNFRFLTPQAREEEDVQVEADDEIDLDPELVIGELAEGNEPPEEFTPQEAGESELANDPDWIKMNEDQDYEIITSLVTGSEWQEEVGRLNNRKLFDIGYMRKIDNVYSKINNITSRFKSFLRENDSQAIFQTLDIITNEYDITGELLKIEENINVEHEEMITEQVEMKEQQDNLLSEQNEISHRVAMMSKDEIALKDQLENNKNGQINDYDDQNGNAAISSIKETIKKLRDEINQINIKTQVYNNKLFKCTIQEKGNINGKIKEIEGEEEFFE